VVPAPAPPATVPAPPPPPAPTPAAPTEIAVPRLPVAYSARSMKELSKVLSVIEGEAIDRGKAPESVRGVTSAIAEEAFAGFAPGQLIELHPREIYYAIVRAARAGKSASTIRALVRSAYQQGNL
jgi:hypothetical protein